MVSTQSKEEGQRLTMGPLASPGGGRRGSAAAATTRSSAAGEARGSAATATRGDTRRIGAPEVQGGAAAMVLPGPSVLGPAVSTTASEALRRPPKPAAHGRTPATAGGATAA